MPVYRKVIEMVITWMLMALIIVNPLQAEEWRGIKPLRSTRSDVERLLGLPKTAKQDTSSYEFESESVFIIYSSGQCKDKSTGWNVPRDTVISISVNPKVKPKLDELKLDQSKYEKVIEGDYLDFVTYRNDEAGIAYEVDAPKGLVNSVRYLPTVKDNYLRCPALPQNPDDGIEDSRKFDNYSNIPLDEENRRLNDFATQLQVGEPDAKGYIIVYAGRQARAGEAQARADRVKDYLVRMRGLDPAHIVTIDGGYREKTTVELWIRPNGWRAPKASPTVDPSEVQIIKVGKNNRHPSRPRCK
jgi:hypothetical protein